MLTPHRPLPMPTISQLKRRRHCGFNMSRALVLALTAISTALAPELLEDHGKPHGPGHRYSEPPCSSTTTTSPPSSTTCTSTLCADYINSCGQIYGGCYPACSGHTTPSFTDPGCPTPCSMATTLTANATPSFCEKTYWDSVDACGHFIGGCASYCGEPYSSVVTSTPYCSITPTPTWTTSLQSCDPVCDLTTDACNNVYGPGCGTYCFGDPWSVCTGSVPSCSAHFARATVTATSSH